MGETCRKGLKAEMIIAAEAIKRGFRVALPIGHDWRYDLIVERNGKLERVQCKYTVSTEDLVTVRCKSNSAWVHYKYTTADIDWLAVYDERTTVCYYIPSTYLGNGRATIHMRLSMPKSKQRVGLIWAKDFLEW